MNRHVTTVPCTVEPLEARRLLSAGDPDLSFGFRGRAAFPRDGNEFFRDAVLLPDGKMLFGGTSAPRDHRDPDQYVLRRFTADGSIDTTFGGGDGSVYGFYVNANADSGITDMLAQPDGKVLARYDGLGHDGLARFNADGTLDATFAGGGFLSGRVWAAGLAPGGKVVAAIESTIVRLNPDGSHDTSFGGGDGIAERLGVLREIETLQVADDGRIILGGNEAVPGVGVFGAAARLNDDGSLDESFGDEGRVVTDVDNSLWDLVALPGGKVLGVGTEDGAFAVVRLDADGSPDASFGGDGRADVPFGRFAFSPELLVDEDGNVIVSGDYFDGFAVARLEPDGDLDPSFGRAITARGGQAFGSGITPDGDVLVAGTDDSETIITRFLGDDPAPPSPVVRDPTTRVVSIPGTRGNDVSGVVEVQERGLVQAHRNGFGRVFDVADVASVAISGRAGDDLITIRSTTVPAHVTGGDGADRIVGGGAADTLQGNLGPDRIEGGGGADAINAGAGNDAVLGGDGDDSLTGGHGDDELRGNAGADVYDTAGAGNNYVIDIGTRDLTFSRATGLLTFFDKANGDDDLLVSTDGAGGLTVTSGGLTDTIAIARVTKIELNGNGGNDRLRLDPSVTIAALLYGGVGPKYGPGGDDTLVGGSGNDTLVGHGDEDVIEGGGGNDRIFADDGTADQIRGGAGDDSAEVDQDDDVLEVETVT